MSETILDDSLTPLRARVWALMAELAAHLPEGGFFTFSGPLVCGGKSYDLTFRASPAPVDMCSKGE